MCQSIFKSSRTCQLLPLMKILHFQQPSSFPGRPLLRFHIQFQAQSGTVKISNPFFGSSAIRLPIKSFPKFLYTFQCWLHGFFGWYPSYIFQSVPVSPYFGFLPALKTIPSCSYISFAPDFIIYRRRIVMKYQNVRCISGHIILFALISCSLSACFQPKLPTLRQPLLCRQHGPSSLNYILTALLPPSASSFLMQSQLFTSTSLLHWFIPNDWAWLVLVFP